MSDAEILFPDETIEVGGKSVTVREFRYVEGLKAAAIARPFLAGLRAFISEREEIDPESLDALIGVHSDVWVQLISISTREPIDWLVNLSDEDGLELSMTFWRVNASFFTRRLVMGSVVAMKMRSESPTPSQNSSQPDSAKTTTPSESD